MPARTDPLRRFLDGNAAAPISCLWIVSRVSAVRLSIVVLFVFLGAVQQAYAAEPRCFGAGKGWCAWPLDEDRFEEGWRVAYRAESAKTEIEAIIDSPGNRPQLGIRLLSADEPQPAQVIISLRADGNRPDQWLQFVGRNRRSEDGAMRLALGRRALEAVLQAPESATLYVFVECQTQGKPRKNSYKIPLTGLTEALRYARLGR